MRSSRRLLVVVRTAAVMGALSILGACGQDTSGAASPPGQAPAAEQSAAPTATQSAPASAPQADAAAPPSDDVRRAPQLVATRGRVEVYQGLLAQEPSAADLAAGKVVQLKVMTNPALGRYVADRQGRTLYRFDKDSADPSRATCAGSCADTWPPLLVKATGRIYVSGVDPKLVRYVERADGRCQVTIGGWPVYAFAEDLKPGDIKGQGVGGTWFAVAPDGAKA